MAETYLNLLNSAAAVSAKVYEQIDNSMTQRMNIEAQAGKFQVDAMAKAGQFAEQQRVNDEQIMNMRAGNYLQAQRLEVDKMLMPIKLETENLRLESQRLAFQRAKEQEGKTHFNSLTSVYDDQIGYALLETESPEMAQEYLGYKARVSDFVAKGGKFDSISFEKSLADIRSKYAKVRPSSIEQIEYNPQTSYLLGQVSPKLQSEYDKRHPLVKGSRNSVANQFYNVDEKGLNSLTSSGALDKLYNPEEVGLLWSGRQAVQGNYANIERWNKDLSRERNDKADAQAKMATPGELVQYDKNIAQYTEQIRAAMDQNMKIFKDSSLGKYGIQAPEVPPVGPPKPGQDTKDISGYPTEKTKLKFTTPKYKDMNPDQEQVGSGIDQIHLALSSVSQDDKGNIIRQTPIEETEVSELDLSWAQGDVPTADTKENIKRMVEYKVGKMVGDSPQDIGMVATKEKINKLLALIDNDVEIPISKSTVGVIAQANNGQSRGIRVQGYNKYRPSKDSEDDISMTIAFGPKDEGLFDVRDSFQNADQIFSAVGKIRNPTQRAIALREIYESLITASVTNRVTRKEDR